jgi:hypothetical protein
MLLDDKIYLGTSTEPEYLSLKYGNRHGLVTGATGTGKTLLRSLRFPRTPGERAAVLAASPVGATYDTPVDRESAYEVLTRKAAATPAAGSAPKACSRESFPEAAMKSFTRAMASSAGRQIMNTVGSELVRGVLGGLLRR